MNIFGKEMTRQEIFDLGVSAILKQGEPAARVVETGYMCFYRAPNGCKCLIGHLIPDDQYRPNLEGALAVTVLDGTLDDTPFLNDLQVCHDDAAHHRTRDGSEVITGAEFIANFRDRALQFARKYHLDTGVLQS